MNMQNTSLAKELNESYIEYYNNFLTIERYALYKGWTIFFTKQVIKAGRKINHNQDMLNAIYS